MENRKDIYAEVTNEIIKQLESGIIPWKKPWVTISGGAISHSTGKPYSLLNQILIARPGEYITFNQCKAEGGHVKKGAKAKRVVFWKQLPVEAKDENGEPITDEDGNVKLRLIPYLKSYQVFNVDDCEGIETKFFKAHTPICTNPAEIDETADSIFHEYVKREEITVNEDEYSNEAYYAPALDLINLPSRKQFTDTAEYYGTVFHEATHSTGHNSRLDRLTTGRAAAFGKSEYSKEELVAEIGSACILREIGIDTESSIKNSAAYIQSWLKALRNDKKMIVSAAGKAEKAAKYILNVTD